MTSRRAWRPALMAALAVPLLLSGDAPGRSQLTLPTALTGDLVTKGLRLLKSLPLIEVNARLELSFHVSPGPSTAPPEAAGAVAKRCAELGARLGAEANPVLKAQLQALLQRLEADQRRDELLAEQNRTLTRILDHQVRVFEYQRGRDEALLRKERYAVPANKLVVVVADFSGGGDEGREVADEIAHHLHELKKYGIDVHVLHGEVKPGVVIRSEEMARDLGKHFPPQTDYVVLWGSLSPRTVGRYRPHLTCVRAASPGRGVSVSFPIDLDAGDLPLAADPEKYRRECYDRLVGVTCAAVPGCYAAYLVRRERTPDLERFYAFLGKDSEEVKRFRADLEPFTRWTRAVAAAGRSVHRLSEVSSENPYPRALANDKDDSVLVLLTGEAGRPRRFPSALPGREEIVYIDVLEASTAQYVRFLNESGGNKEEGGAPWVKIDPEFTDIVEGGRACRSRPKRGWGAGR